MAWYKVENEDSHVINTLVWGCTEMFPHVCVESFVCDFAKMLTKSGHESALHLAHILVSTSGAMYSIDEIQALTGYIGLGTVGAASGFGCYMARSV